MSASRWRIDPLRPRSRLQHLALAGKRLGKLAKDGTVAALPRVARNGGLALSASRPG
jgi:hypothetical protein